MQVNTIQLRAMDPACAHNSKQGLTTDTEVSCARACPAEPRPYQIFKWLFRVLKNASSVDHNYGKKR